MVSTRSRQASPAPGHASGSGTLDSASASTRETRSRAKRGRASQGKHKGTKNVPVSESDTEGPGPLKTISSAGTKRRASGPTSRLEVFIATRPESTRSRNRAPIAAVSPPRPSSPEIPLSQPTVAKKPISEIQRPITPVRPLLGRAPNSPTGLARNVVSTSKEPSTPKKPTQIAPSSLQAQVTAAAKTPEKSKDTAAPSLKRKRSLTQIGPPRPKSTKPSILSFGNLKPQDNTRRASANASISIAASSSSRANTSSFARRAVSGAGLLTPEASTSVVSRGSSASATNPGNTIVLAADSEIEDDEHDGDVDMDADIDGPRASLEKAMGPLSPMYTSSDGRTYRSSERKRTRISHPGTISVDDNDVTDAAENLLSEDSAAAGFQMIDLSDVMAFPPWISTEYTVVDSRMYVPQWVQPMLDNMHLTLETETTTRLKAERALTAEVQKSARLERRIRELEARLRPRRSVDDEDDVINDNDPHRVTDQARLGQLSNTEELIEKITTDIMKQVEVWADTAVSKVNVEHVLTTMVNRQGKGKERARGPEPTQHRNTGQGQGNRGGEDDESTRSDAMNNILETVNNMLSITTKFT